MKGVTLVTLVPGYLTDEQKQWVDECINSVKGTSFKHILIPCVDEQNWYYNRINTYTIGGFIGCLDYDDYILPEVAEEFYKEIVDGGHKGQLYFSYETLRQDDKFYEPRNRIVTPRDVTQNQRTVHHLTILNSSVIPKSLTNTIENLGLQKNVDWICKAYVALKFKALQFPKSTYIWRQHENNHTKLWKEDYQKIQLKTIDLLKCIAPSDQSLLKPYQVIGS